MMRSTFVGLVCSVTLMACGGSAPDAQSDSVTNLSAEGATDAVASRSWRIEAPESWDDRIQIVEDPDGLAALEKQGIYNASLFNYLPFDTTVVPQTLLGIYVYDSTSWARLEAVEGPPQGELIVRGPGLAFVAGLPPSNPFTPGTRDSIEFDKRSVTMEFVRRSFRVVP